MGTETVGKATAAKLEANWPYILEAVADGERYSVILEEVGISYASMRHWRAESPERRAQWDEARRESASALIQRLLDTIHNAAGLDPARARVQLDTLKFLIEKLDPDRYGQRTRVDVRHIDMGETLRLAHERATAWRVLRAPIPIHTTVLETGAKLVAELL